MSFIENKLKHRSVVSNFIFKYGESPEPLVALFRRSDKVRTYQGKLAPISGSIDSNDANALEAAKRELNEETQLVANKDLVLDFCGKPFFIKDEGIRRSWTVHAFSWILKAPESSIKIDWEHSRWEWVPPQEILDGRRSDDCVPDLDNSLKRVYFGPHGIFPGDSPLITRDNDAGKSFLAGLEKLKTDHENGARVLATEAVKSLHQTFEDLQADSNSTGAKSSHRSWWTCLRIASWHLIYSARPSMNAAISSAVLQMLKGILQILESDQTIDMEEISKQIDNMIRERESSSTETSEAFTSYIKSRISESKFTNRPGNDDNHENSKLNILTLSSSSTIRAALLHTLTSIPHLTTNLLIFESRPLCEGATLASSLLKSLTTSSPAPSSTLNITIAPDSHLSLLAQDLTKTTNPSLLLLGADRISPSGHVSNKTGSLSAAIVTKTLCPNTSIVVLSEGDKIANSTPPDHSHDQRENDQEVMSEDTDSETNSHSREHNSPEEVSRIWNLAGAGDDTARLLTTKSISDNVHVTIENIYFEWVPARYIDLYISEEGVMGLERIREISEEKRGLEERIFGDLYE